MTTPEAVWEGRSAWLACLAASLLLSCNLGTPIGGDHRTEEDLRRERLQERISRGEHGNIAATDSLVIRKLLDLNGLDTAQVRTRTYADENGKVFAIFLDWADMDTLRFPADMNSVPVEWLYARMSTFTSISGEIAKIATLTQLNLSEHQMTDVPDFVFDLPGLRYVTLSDGKIREWPQGFVSKVSQAKKLENISLLNNDLSSLPPNYKQWDRRVGLVLNYNRLCSLSEEEKTFLNSEPSKFSWSYQRCN